ncbi:MAG: hypothetical protein JHC93_05910 [Parachlamydiales bacterium]|nr:hypothetical protein [Parachlamydiales bacterium]
MHPLCGHENYYSVQASIPGNPPKCLGLFKDKEIAKKVSNTYRTYCENDSSSGLETSFICHYDRLTHTPTGNIHFENKDETLTRVHQILNKKVWQSIAQVNVVDTQKQNSLSDGNELNLGDSQTESNVFTTKYYTVFAKIWPFEISQSVSSYANEFHARGVADFFRSINMSQYNGGIDVRVEELEGQVINTPIGLRLIETPGGCITLIEPRLSQRNWQWLLTVELITTE